MNYSRFGAIREVDSEQAVAPLCGHAGRVLGRILKVGVQNLKQGVQVQWTTISDVSVDRICHVAGQFCAVAI